MKASKVISTVVGTAVAIYCTGLVVIAVLEQFNIYTF